MKTLKRLTFSILGCIIAVLVTATIVEKLHGTAFVAQNIYGSRWFTALWAVFAAMSLAYILRQKLYRRRAVFMIHISFILILAGAFVTHVGGRQGMLHLREGEPVSSFVSGGGDISLPFTVDLDSFEVVYYAGTPSPMDYVSALTITDAGETVRGEVSMNRILSYRGYRFYQSGYDDDGQGTTLAVSWDPFGIAVTYTGYALLLVSLVMFFFVRNTRFRALVRNSRLQKAAVAAIFLLSGPAVFAASDTGLPRTLPRETAAEFGDMYVLYNNRICPLQTLAKDFTTKLYGEPRYRGMTSEQVLAGWMFFYSDWKSEPMIKTKGGEASRLLGVDGKYVSLDDFIGEFNEYRLDGALYDIRRGADVPGRKGIVEADEKYNIVRFLYSGRMLKIFPYSNGGDVAWYAQGDDLPVDMDDGKWLFTRKTQDYIHEMVVKNDYAVVSATLKKIREYQRKEAAGVLPPDARFRAEKIYNGFTYTKVLAMACSTVGIISFLFCSVCMALGRRIRRMVPVALTVLAVAVWTYLTANIVLRWIVGGHVPLSNGYETMQFMAWCSISIAFALRRRPIFLPLGFLLCGLTLMVSMMGESNPQVTQLVPVLSSPLLSIHVVTVMTAYSLFAFMMLNGVAAFIVYFLRRPGWQEQAENLQNVSRMLLYPALFSLTVGIFVGAVWANVSWGRYWGWDPKEVWALVTMLVYSLAIHADSLPLFRRPLFFHAFCVAAFLTVLVTYFGVNFILGGMHSYA